MKSQTRIALAIAAAAVITVPSLPAPALAQIDWIGIKIDNDRIWQHQRRKANKNRKVRTGTRRKPRTSRTPNNRKISGSAPVDSARHPQVPVNGQALKSTVYNRPARFVAYADLPTRWQ